MKNLFSMESPVFSFLTKVANMAILSVLWTVFSIPIVTMGAATTAMYSVQIRLLQDMDDSIVKNFLKSFRRDFAQSTVRFLILLPALAIVAYNALFVFGILPGLSMLARIGVGFVSALLLVYVGYIFPLTAQFQNTNKQTLKNAIFFTLRFLPQSIFAFLIDVFPFAVMYYLDMDIVSAMLFYTCVIVAFVSNFKMRIYRKLFLQYIPADPEAAS